MLLVAGVCLLAGCSGGGGSASSTGGGGGTPPPPPPDFTLDVQTSVIAQSAGLPQPFKISFGNSQNNLPVTVTISAMPSGLSLYGGSTHTFTDAIATPSYTWNIGVGAAASGSSSFTVSATNGSVTHTWTVNVTITQGIGFQVNLSPSSLTLTPGQSGAVQATVTGTNIPSGVTLGIGSYPVGSEFSAVQIQAAGTNAWTLHLTAPLTVTATTVPLFVEAYVNNNTSSAVAVLNLTVNQSFPAVTALTRSNFVRFGDAPSDAVYDAARKMVFVSYARLNRVVVYSSIDQHMVATIAAPLYQPLQQGEQTIDESVDGTRVYVGSAGKIVIIDPASMQVVGSAATPLSSSYPYAGPVQLVTLADGNVLVENGDGQVYLWNPATNAFTLDDPPSSPNGGSPNGPLTRSADHSKALLYGLTGPILFSSGTDTYGVYGRNVVAKLALSPDGSQIAGACSTNAIPEDSVWFYDDSFNVIGGAESDAACQGGYAIYGLDGKTVYFFLTVPGSGNAGVAYDTTTFQPTGVFETWNITAVAQPLAIDESGLIFGSAIQGAGLAVTDASHPGAIGPDPDYNNGGEPSSFAFPYPNVTLPMAVHDNDVSLNTPVPNYLPGNGYDANSTYQIFAGAPPGGQGSMQASGVSVGSGTQLNFTTPASSTPGPVNLTLTRSDGWNVVLPDAITYGPDALAVYPNAIPATQPATMTVIGYGIGTDGGATAGGSAATTTTAVPLSTSNGDLPLETMQMTTNSGTPGWADVTIANPSGTTTLHHAVQFLKSMNTYPLIGSLAAVVYDRTHQRLYVSNTSGNNVAVFDLATSTFASSIAVGHGPTRLALSADNSTLAVLNQTDATLSVIDTSQLKVTGTWAVVTVTEKAAGAIPSLLTFGTPHDVVVGFPGLSLHLLDLTTGSMSCTGVAGCDSTGVNLQPGFYVGRVSSSPDGTKVVFEGLISNGNTGEIAVLDLTQNTLTPAASMPAGSDVLAVNADKNTIADGLNVYDAQLRPVTTIGGDEIYYTSGLPGGSVAAGNFDVLNPSGSLLFVAASTPQDGVFALDVHHGNVAMRIAPADRTALSTMALDETGTRLFCVTTSGLTIIQLYEAPLSIGSVAPASGMAGTTVTIRGSGFESGTKVSFGGTSAAVTFVDAMTLQVSVPPSLPSGPVQITITNPDGSRYALDAAFTEN
ncbi:MAG TPA: IPT/TIG domain-containing protein [Acidobacteriaceae bacterium]|nr:IPT/TIG domain-containing protein [Acidobacteriaceae bacterium]